MIFESSQKFSAGFKKAPFFLTLYLLSTMLSQNLVAAKDFFPLAKMKWIPCPVCEDVKKERPAYDGLWLRLDWTEIFFGSSFEFGKPSTYQGDTAEFVACLVNDAIYQCSGGKYRIVRNVTLENDILTFTSSDLGQVRFVKALDCSKKNSIGELEVLTKSSPFEYSWSCQGSHDCGGRGAFSFRNDGTYRVDESTGGSNPETGEEYVNEASRTGRFFYEYSRGLVFLCDDKGRREVFQYNGGESFGWDGQEWKASTGVE